MRLESNMNNLKKATPVGLEVFKQKIYSYAQMVKN